MKPAPLSDKMAKAARIIKRLSDAGFPAYVAGGAVRDMVMGAAHEDIDIATAAPPERVAALFEKTVPVGAAFGVILVLEDGEPFEVATFRTEGPYRDGRRPESVAFTDAETDVRRRDFTLNGLLYDPESDRVIDWVGGRDDIARRTIRAIGNPKERFDEDKLRLLRAIRFASTLGFDIEAETGEAVRRAAEMIRVVSGERVRNELIKIFTGPAPGRGLELLDGYGLLAPLLPELHRMKGVLQGEEYHPEGDVFRHTMKILSLLERPTTSLAFAALLHDVGKPATENPGGKPLFPKHAEVGAAMAAAILDRLRFPSALRERIVRAIENHLRFFDVRHMREATLRRFMSAENYREELELHRLDCLAGNGNLANWTFLKEKEIEFASAPLSPAPLLRGDDLLRLGFRPGPLVGRILREIDDLKLEGRLKTPEDAERWVHENYPRAG